MKLVKEYKKGNLEVSQYKAIVPLKKDGYYIPVKGILEMYWSHEYYAHSQDHPMMFFPKDGGEPVKVTSSMWRWIKKGDKNPECLYGRCDRLQFMDENNLSFIKNKYKLKTPGFINRCKEIDEYYSTENKEYLEFLQSVVDGTCTREEMRNWFCDCCYDDEIDDAISDAIRSNSKYLTFDE